MPRPAAPVDTRKYIKIRGLPLKSASEMNNPFINSWTRVNMHLKTDSCDIGMDKRNKEMEGGRSKYSSAIAGDDSGCIKMHVFNEHCDVVKSNIYLVIQHALFEPKGLDGHPSITLDKASTVIQTHQPKYPMKKINLTNNLSTKNQVEIKVEHLIQNKLANLMTSSFLKKGSGGFGLKPLSPKSS